MKITETIRPKNADKTIVGSRDIQLILDTETGELEIDTPAMFANPTTTLEEMREKLESLERHYPS